jgi:hypothetical protein
MKLKLMKTLKYSRFLVKMKTPNGKPLSGLLLKKMYEIHEMVEFDTKFNNEYHLVAYFLKSIWISKS